MQYLCIVKNTLKLVLKQKCKALSLRKCKNPKEKLPFLLYIGFKENECTKDHGDHYKHFLIIYVFVKNSRKMVAFLLYWCWSKQIIFRTHFVSTLAKSCIYVYFTLGFEMHSSGYNKEKWCHVKRHSAWSLVRSGDAMPISRDAKTISRDDAVSDDVLTLLGDLMC